MKIVETYSHMNGREYLSLRKPEIYAEIWKTIADVDSRPNVFSETFRKSFDEKGWKASRCFCYGCKDSLQDVAGLSLSEQRRYLERTGRRNPIKSFMRMGLVKNRVAIETPSHKSLGTRPDALLKHLLFYSGDMIDVGVEILPVKAMTEDPNGGRLMSTGVAYYEGEVYNILRHGRNSPPVPLVIIGIGPQAITNLSTTTC